VFIAAGVTLLLVRERFLQATNASNAVLFGRFDPAARWPGFTRFWNLAILVLVGVTITIVGLLIVGGAIGVDA
jgi:hypothetical protein